MLACISRVSSRYVTRSWAAKASTKKRTIVDLARNISSFQAPAVPCSNPHFIFEGDNFNQARENAFAQIKTFKAKLDEYGIAQDDIIREPIAEAEAHINHTIQLANELKEAWSAHSDAIWAAAEQAELHKPSKITAIAHQVAGLEPHKTADIIQYYNDNGDLDIHKLVPNFQPLMLQKYGAEAMAEMEHQKKWILEQLAECDAEDREMKAELRDLVDLTIDEAAERYPEQRSKIEKMYMEGEFEYLDDDICSDHPFFK